jgi:hypothetical protein
MRVPLKKKDRGCTFTLVLIVIIGLVIVSNKGTDTSTNHYVKPYHTRTGKVVKGHTRKSVSTNPNAVKRQNYNKGYYHRNSFRYRKTQKK